MAAKSQAKLPFVWHSGAVFVGALAGYGYSRGLSSLGFQFTGAGHGTAALGMVGYGPGGIGRFVWSALGGLAALPELRWARRAGWIMLGAAYVWLFYLVVTSASEMSELLRISIGDSQIIFWSMLFFLVQGILLVRFILGRAKTSRKAAE